jgi:hypothetical protein
MTFLVFVGTEAVYSLAHPQRGVIVSWGLMNLREVVGKMDTPLLPEKGDLLLEVVCLLLPCRIIDNLSILPRSHRDLCRRVLIGVHGCILAHGLGCSLVDLGRYRGVINCLRRRYVCVVAVERRMRYGERKGRIDGHLSFP